MMRTMQQKEKLAEQLGDFVDEMQDIAERAELAGDSDVFQILDAAAERLRELYR